MSVTSFLFGGRAFEETNSQRAGGSTYGSRNRGDFAIVKMAFVTLRTFRLSKAASSA
jgi:hypothetical protein